MATIGNRFDVTKVLDFGLVKELTILDANRSRPEGIAGTPLYMAPEQAAEDEPIDRRADLYAIGGVAFYMLTGKPPFERDTFLGTLMAHATQPPVAPSSLNPAVPADVDAIVLRCLAKSPADRYADATALYRALESCQSAKDWDSERAADWWGNLAAATTLNSQNRENG